MMKYIYKYCPSHIFISFIQSLFANISSIIGILFIKYVIDSLTYNRAYRSILLIALGIFIFNTLISTITTYLTQYVMQRNTQLLSRGMLNEIFTQSTRIDYQCYEDPKFFSDFTMAVEQSDRRALDVLQTFTTFISSIFGITSFSVFISVLEPFLFLVVFFNVVINIYFMIRNSKLQHDFYEERLKPGREQGYAQRVFYLNSFAKELRLYIKLSEVIRSTFNKAIDKLIEITYKYARIFTKRLIAQNIFSNLISLFTTLYIAFKVIKGYLKISDYFTLTSSIGQLSSQITNLFQVFPQLYEHSLYIENFLNFMYYDPHIKNESNSEMVDNGKNIKFKNVSFSYPNNGTKKVLSEVSFEIKANEKVAFVGENGSGKSTLIKIITRLYDIDKGSVDLDNLNIKKYNIESLRDNIGIIFQDFQLLSVSILENILMRPIQNNEVDEEIAYNALRKVGLYNKVKALPNGLYTKYSNEYDELGTFLSGGEMQAIAIARIYAKQCNVVILDEPSSALDPIAEQKIFDMTLNSIKDKTIILISHRLTNIKNVDKIFYIEKGSIIESGSHESLMNLQGKYYNMYNMQAQNYQ